MSLLMSMHNQGEGQLLGKGNLFELPYYKLSHLIQKAFLECLIITSP